MAAPTQATPQHFEALSLDLGDILLRPFHAGDLPGIVEACSDVLTQRWLPLPSPYTEADARFYLENQTDFRESGQGVQCAVAVAEDDTLIGAVSVKQTNWRTRITDICYWSHPAARGQGHMTRATRALSLWALEQGIERVELRCAPDNAGSNGVALRAGFTLEGTLRNAGLIHAGRVDLNLYSLIRADRDADAARLTGLAG